MGGMQKICAACGSSSGSNTSGGFATSSNAKEVVKRATAVKKDLTPEEMIQKAELKTARSNETKAKTKAAKALATEDAPGSSTEINDTTVKTEKKKKIVDKKTDKKELSPDELEVKAALKTARSKATKDATKARKSLIEVVEVESPSDGDGDKK